MTGESVGAPQDRLWALRLLAETAERQGDQERAAAYRDRAATAAERAPAAACEVHGDWLDSRAV